MKVADHIQDKQDPLPDFRSGPTTAKKQCAEFSSHSDTVLIVRENVAKTGHRNAFLNVTNPALCLRCERCLTSDQIFTCLDTLKEGAETYYFDLIIRVTLKMINWFE